MRTRSAIHVDDIAWARHFKAGSHEQGCLSWTVPFSIVSLLLLRLSCLANLKWLISPSHGFSPERSQGRSAQLSGRLYRNRMVISLPKFVPLRRSSHETTDAVLRGSYHNCHNAAGCILVIHPINVFNHQRSIFFSPFYL